jgi:hypothetical protein
MMTRLCVLFSFCISLFPAFSFTVSQKAHGQTPSTFGAQIHKLIPREHGIDFLHSDGSNGKHYIMETVIGALALLDYDRDGWIDLYLTSGIPLPGSPPNSGTRSRLFRNVGGLQFEDVTERAGIMDGGYAMGVVAGDFDQDGDSDLFLTHWGNNTFFINEGDGTFRDATVETKLSTGERFGAGSLFFDMDQDGDLDIYSASYVDFSMDRHRVRKIDGYEFSLGPSDYPASRHFLFRNDGMGGFEDVSQWAGLADLRAAGMGVLSADFDEDGDMDIFVANDQAANFLLLNNGEGQMTDAGLASGVAFDRYGKANGNMGIEYADINADGRLDFLTTTYQEEMPVYYECVDPGVYQDATNIAKIDSRLYSHVTWGVGAIDFDNDRDRDLFFACGHFLKNLHFIDDRTQLKVPNFLLANDGRGKFANVSSIAGSALAEVQSSRGAAFDDLDNDGDVDLVVLNVNSEPTIGINEVVNGNRGLSLELVGVRCNRDAIGSVVVLETLDGVRQKQVVLAGRGYESHYGHRLYFGLGRSQVTSVEVTWPSGHSERFVPKSQGGSHTGTELLLEGTGNGTRGERPDR